MNNSISLLTVDDDATDAKLIKHALAELNIECGFIHFIGYQDLLEYLRSPGFIMPCIILMDLNTPQMSGFEFLEIIKNDPIFRRIPAIVLSGSTSLTDVNRSYSLGAAGYMPKPGDYEELKNMLGIIHKYWFVNKLPAIY